VQAILAAARIYGGKTAAWCRRLMYYNRGLAIMEFLGEIKENHPHDPTPMLPPHSKSALSYVKVTNTPRVRLLQDLFKRRLYRAWRARDASLFDLMGTYGRDRLRMY
jgi:hypothetical protein